jgi:methylphosphotriester-DNA--protein-cysteine methyltransferase
MRRLQDPDNAGLKKVLEQLLSTNVDVTVREVARQHPELKNASAFTRNEERMALILAARQQQEHVRSIAAGLTSPSTSPAAAKHVEGMSVHQTAEAQVLQLKLRRMVAAHAALIRAVQLAGGMGALERFWKEYKDIADTVVELEAVPANAVVLEFSQAQHAQSHESPV